MLFFKRSEQKILEDRAKHLALMISILNRAIFNNLSIPVKVTPYSFNEDWFHGIASYNFRDDEYWVNTRNVTEKRLFDISDCGLFSVGAHEVRHRFQNKNPQSLLSPGFLLNQQIIKREDYLRMEQKLGKEVYAEIDSHVIEEVIRNGCSGLNLKGILKEKIQHVTQIMTCNEQNFISRIF
jgi:hypothetical protein